MCDKECCCKQGMDANVYPLREHPLEMGQEAELFPQEDLRDIAVMTLIRLTDNADDYLAFAAAETLLRA